MDYSPGDTCKKNWLPVCKSLSTRDVILTVGDLRIASFYVLG